MSSKITSVENIANKIFFIRGQKVMFDRDLARLYGVDTRYLNKAVSRNIERFPEDFMFQLSKEETAKLMFQIGTSSHGGIRKNPRVFTEQGVAMLSGVLRSKRAVHVNITIMRAFVKLRATLSLNKELAGKLSELERKVTGHDAAIHAIFESIRQLMKQEVRPKKRIGFH